VKTEREEGASKNLERYVRGAVGASGVPRGTCGEERRLLRSLGVSIQKGVGVGIARGQKTRCNRVEKAISKQGNKTGQNTGNNHENR